MLASLLKAWTVFSASWTPLAELPQPLSFPIWEMGVRAAASLGPFRNENNSICQVLGSGTGSQPRSAVSIQCLCLSFPCSAEQLDARRCEGRLEAVTPLCSQACGRRTAHRATPNPALTPLPPVGLPEPFTRPGPQILRPPRLALWTSQRSQGEETLRTPFLRAQGLRQGRLLGVVPDRHFRQAGL